MDLEFEGASQKHSNVLLFQNKLVNLHLDIHLINQQN